MRGIKSRARSPPRNVCEMAPYNALCLLLLVVAVVVTNTIGAPLPTEQQCELLCTKCGGKSDFKENNVCFCEVSEDDLNDKYLEMEKNKKLALDSGLLLVFVPPAKNRYERCVLGLKNQLGARGAEIVEKAKHKLIHVKKKKKIIGDAKAADDTEVAAANPIDVSQTKMVGSTRSGSTDAEDPSIVGQAHNIGTFNKNSDTVGSAKDDEIVESPTVENKLKPLQSIGKRLGPVSPIHREESE